MLSKRRVKSHFIVQKGQNNTGHLLNFNSFTGSGDFCRLPITFANSLGPDQARQNVGPGLGPNCLTL